VATAVALVAVLLGSGCGGGSSTGGDPTGPSGSTDTSAAASSAPAGVASQTPVSEGGPRVTAERLSVSMPAGLSGSSDNLDGAAVTYRGTPPPQGGPQPLVALFVEHRPVGPLEVRTQLLAKLRSAQVGAEPSGPARQVAVRGALGAQVLDWRWTYPASGSTPSGAVRLVEVVIQTAGPDQYGVKFVGPAPVLTDAAVDGLIASLRIEAATPSPSASSATASA
jgi:hypothetical protein